MLKNIRNTFKQAIAVLISLTLTVGSTAIVWGGEESSSTDISVAAATDYSAGIHFIDEQDEIDPSALKSDHIYLGQDGGDPNLWRVIKGNQSGETTLTLLSEYLLNDTSAFNNSVQDGNDYSDSAIQKHLAALSDGVGSDDLFSVNENAEIQAETVSTDRWVDFSNRVYGYGDSELGVPVIYDGPLFDFSNAAMAADTLGGSGDEKFWKQLKIKMVRWSEANYDAYKARFPSVTAVFSSYTDYLTTNTGSMAAYKTYLEGVIGSPYAAGDQAYYDEIFPSAGGYKTVEDADVYTDEITAQKLWLPAAESDVAFNATPKHASKNDIGYIYITPSSSVNTDDVLLNHIAVKKNNSVTDWKNTVWWTRSPSSATKTVLGSANTAWANVVGALPPRDYVQGVSSTPAAPTATAYPGPVTSDEVSTPIGVRPALTLNLANIIHATKISAPASGYETTVDSSISGDSAITAGVPSNNYKLTIVDDASSVPALTSSGKITSDGYLAPGDSVTFTQGAVSGYDHLSYKLVDENGTPGDITDDFIAESGDAADTSTITITSPYSGFAPDLKLYIWNQKDEAKNSNIASLPFEFAPAADVLLLEVRPNVTYQLDSKAGTPEAQLTATAKSAILTATENGNDVSEFVTFSGWPTKIEKGGVYTITATLGPLSKTFTITTTTDDSLLPPYKIIEHFGTYVRGSGKTHSARISYENYTDLTALYKDGVLVDKKHYTVSYGSTVITLSNEYLESLSLGPHEQFEAEFPGGKSAYVTLYVVEGPGSSTAPATGDLSNPLLLLMVCGGALVALIVLLARRKRWQFDFQP